MKNRLKIVVINGPNLNLLHERDPKTYGNLSLKTINESLSSEFPDADFSFYQSNLEGEIVQIIHDNRNLTDGFIINCGGYSHTSVAIMDALALVNVPKIEVHLSHLGKREEFRQIFMTAKTCDGYITGFRHHGYSAAVFLLKKLILERIYD